MQKPFMILDFCNRFYIFEYVNGIVIDTLLIDERIFSESLESNKSYKLYIL